MRQLFIVVFQLANFLHFLDIEVDLLRIFTLESRLFRSHVVDNLFFLIPH